MKKLNGERVTIRTKYLDDEARRYEKQIALVTWSFGMLIAGILIATVMAALKVVLG